MSTHYRRALLGLFLGSFAIGTTEFAPMGLLPEIAQGVGVSIPQAGALVSAYALGVMLGAPVMTGLLHAMRRKHALMVLMVVFAVGNLLTSASDTYLELMLARIVTSLSHGAFFGIGAVVASSVVPVDKRATAVAFMFMGLTIANVGGVPAATWVGQWIGWKMAFGLMSGLGILAAVVTGLTLPAESQGNSAPAAAQFQVMRLPTVWLALLSTVLGAGSMFALYTYIAPLLVELSGFGPHQVSGVLALIGLGFTAGNVLSGRMADRDLPRTLNRLLLGLAVILLLYPLLARSPIGALVAVFLWGVAAFGVATPLQLTVIHAAQDAPALASSLNIGAFNLGNALGAAVGAAIIDAGWGLPWVPMAGAVLALGSWMVVTRRLPGLARFPAAQ